MTLTLLLGVSLDYYSGASLKLRWREKCCRIAQPNGQLFSLQLCWKEHQLQIMVELYFPITSKKEKENFLVDSQPSFVPRSKNRVGMKSLKSKGEKRKNKNLLFYLRPSPDSNSCRCCCRCSPSSSSQENKWAPFSFSLSSSPYNFFSNKQCP